MNELICSVKSFQMKVKAPSGQTHLSSVLVTDLLSRKHVLSHEVFDLLQNILTSGRLQEQAVSCWTGVRPGKKHISHVKKATGKTGSSNSKNQIVTDFYLVSRWNQSFFFCKLEERTVFFALYQTLVLLLLTHLCILLKEHCLVKIPNTNFSHHRKIVVQSLYGFFS